MIERPSDPDQSAMPEDVATLYSLANTQGTRYWDFSASRKEVRGQFRLRVAREQAPPVEPAQSLAQSPLQSRELLQPNPFQASQFPAPEFEPPAQSGPVLAPEARPQVETLPQPDPEVATRWYALHSVFAPADVAVPPPSPRMTVEQRPPVVAVFSLAGGVGKTCLVATLGRALSSLGEHVLLADTASCGLLPFYFGSREFKPGVVRTFFHPSARSSLGAKSDAPVHVLSLDVERYPGDGGEHDPLLEELVRDGLGASRILIDVATASREVTRRVLSLRPTLLVPIVPDMSSVASLGSLQVFLDRDGGAGKIFYLLNQFDASSPLHVDVRAMLQQRLGDRLLPFVLSRSSAVSEALAEGMTVIDYAPGSPAAEDYWNLAGWLRSVATPVAVGFGGVRWSER
jgi:cellulose synthase operon protein YhjQ